MALKRINKELTDLGRYVFPCLDRHQETNTLVGAAAQAGFHENHQQLHNHDRTIIVDALLTFDLFVVTHPRPALLVLSGKIWYVLLGDSLDLRISECLAVHETLS